MSWLRWIKAWAYPLLPSASARCHEKRRKGLLYRYVSPEILESQREQDRIFWSDFLRPRGGRAFLEVGAGDGVVGSHTLGLELQHGWGGFLVESRPIPRQRAEKARKCRVLAEISQIPVRNSWDLLAIHRPAKFPQTWKELQSGRLKPDWVVVESRDPDPCWCRLLERSGYRLRFFFQDDEYFKLEI